MPEYPKTLSDPTGSQVTDRVVNNPTEEAAARLAGFTAGGAAYQSNPDPLGTQQGYPQANNPLGTPQNPPAFQEPFIQRPAENLTDLNVQGGGNYQPSAVRGLPQTGGIQQQGYPQGGPSQGGLLGGYGAASGIAGQPGNSPYSADYQAQFKSALDEVHSATTHDARDAALSRVDSMVIALEEQAAAAEHVPSTIRRQADLLRRELNTARYVSPKNIPAPQFTTSSAVVDPANPAHPAFSLRNPGVTRSVVDTGLPYATQSSPPQLDRNAGDSPLPYAGNQTPNQQVINQANTGQFASQTIPGNRSEPYQQVAENPATGGAPATIEPGQRPDRPTND